MVANNETVEDIIIINFIFIRTWVKSKKGGKYDFVMSTKYSQHSMFI